MTTRSCIEIASARARHARERVRTSTAPLSPLRGEVAFVVVWVSALLTNLVVASFRVRLAPSPEPAYQSTPQELGVPGPLRPRLSGPLLHGRYRAVPNLSRILRDLRRPAVHDAARAALMARISDPDTLVWAVGLIDSGNVWRLALAARPDASDVDVVTSWRSEAKADKAAADAEAAAALRASIAGANATEGGDVGEVGFRPRGP